jgi:hypothetical protein
MLFFPGDHVQWFGAKAEAMRWREEWERKPMELIQCIRYFNKLADTWDAMADTSSQSMEYECA